MYVNGYDIEAVYMIDGCGHKIKSSRTIVVKKDGKIIFKDKTQERIEEIIKKIETLPG